MSNYNAKQGKQRAKDQDKKLRSDGSTYATKSPLVAPLVNGIMTEVEHVIAAWLQYAIDKKNANRIFGPNEYLRQLLLLFINPNVVSPHGNEREQPALGVGLVAGIVTHVFLDQLHVIGRGKLKVLDLADHIARPLGMEWWSRKVDSTEAMDTMNAALHLYGTKAKSTLKQRVTNVTLMMNRHDHGDTKPDDALVKEASVALISLLCEKTGFLDYDEEKQYISITAQLKNKLETEVLDKGWAHLATPLPLPETPEPWRATGEPDCLNRTGGSKNRHIRKVSPLGHGHHRDYQTTSSPEVIRAINAAQQVRYQLDQQMADFVLALIEHSDQPEWRYPDLAPKPLYTQEDLKNGTGLAAHLPEVRNKFAGLELLPDKDQRNSDNGHKQIKQLLGFDWKENNKTLNKMYVEAVEAEARYIRSVQIQTRIKELRKERYADGFHWCFGMDHRGRVYEKADIFSPQDSGPERHSLMFFQGEQLTEPTQEIYTALGGAYAGTKIGYAERERIGRAMWSQVLEYGKDLVAHRKALAEADDPWLFPQLCGQCYRTFVNGEAWYVPIPIDATQSAVQWWSSMTNDVGAMKLCNLMPATPDDNPYDAYRAVTEAVADLIKSATAKGELDKLFTYKAKNKHRVCTNQEREQVMQAIELRRCLKDSLMTSLYGSAVGTRSETIQAIIKKELDQRIPIELSRLAARIITKAMKAKFGSLYSAMHLIKQVVRSGLNEQYAQWLIQLDETEAKRWTIAPYGTKPTDPDTAPYFISRLRGTPELDLDSTRERIERIQELRNLDDEILELQQKGKPVPEECHEAIEWLEAGLKKQERECTKPTMQKRITDVVAREWRKDNLSRRCYDWHQKAAKEEAEVEAMMRHAAGSVLKWATPDGLTVGVVEPFINESQAISVGVIKQLRCNLPVANSFDHTRVIRASSPGFVHSLDATLLRRVFLSIDADAMLIHDSIATLPSVLPKVRQAVADHKANIIGDDGRELLRTFINGVVTDADTRKKHLDKVEELFPAFPADFNYKDAVSQAIYAWN